MTALRLLLHGLLAGALALPAAAQAARYEATVTYVTDGDTIWVRPVTGGPRQKVRIDGIDAPEICQPFGPQARDALARRVKQKRVTITTRARDDHKRVLARVRLGNEDVGGWMVRQGYAWSYRYRGDRGPYPKQETQARQARAGLWATNRPETPRDFRVRHGSCR